MDLLDRAILPGRDLLSRVDATLASGGIPHDHPIVPLMRRIGVLPGQALEHLAGLDRDVFADASVQLRAWADRYAGHRAGVGAAVAATPWEGASGAAFASLWQALGGHLGAGEAPDEPTMAGRIVALIGYLDSVREWITDTRRELAAALAEVLGSAEAVCLRSVGPDTGPRPGAAPDSGAARAAAEIGLRILATADVALAAGHRLYGHWTPRLTELSFVAPDPERDGGDQTRVDLA